MQIYEPAITILVEVCFYLVLSIGPWLSKVFFQYSCCTLNFQQSLQACTSEASLSMPLPHCSSRLLCHSVLVSWGKWGGRFSVPDPSSVLSRPCISRPYRWAFTLFLFLHVMVALYLWQPSRGGEFPASPLVATDLFFELVQDIGPKVLLPPPSVTGFFFSPFPNAFSSKSQFSYITVHFYGSTIVSWTFPETSAI